jgi:pimeloyl-ACP methyl ester carboxylesterase
VASTPRRLLHIARHSVLRPGADDTYADGDDATWMDVDWHSLTYTAEIEGRAVNYVDTGGDGPPLLFVHGLGALWQSWLLNIPAFMDTHRVVTLDLPGHGRSEMPIAPVSIQNYAKTVDALCDHIGIDCPLVVGNSMGGFIGAELALEYPTRVKKLVLVSAAGLSTEDYQRQPIGTVARTWALGSAAVGSQVDAIARRPRLRRLALGSIFRYPEKLSGPLVIELVTDAAGPGIIPAFEAMVGYSSRDRLAEIEIPVLIVWGENDVLVPVYDAEEYERAIGENARTVTFTDTGHVPMIERPTRFNELVREFFSE